jgi:FlaA1/EpsC-like NDP-sugar epimerase
MSISLGLRYRLCAGLYYLGVVGASFWIAYLLRFDFSIPRTELPLFWRGLAVALLTKIIIFYVMRLDLERWWQYLGITDLIRLCEANVLSSLVFTAASYSLFSPAFPRSIYCLDLLVTLVASAGTRSALRLHHEARAGWGRRNNEVGLLIYGAGVAGITLAREIRANSKLGYRIVGFLDDDLRKQHTLLIGLPVLGTGEDAQRIVEAYRNRRSQIREIVVTMPSATGRQVRTALAKAKAAGMICRVVPGLGELISGKLAVGTMREISVTDLLGREPVKLDQDCVKRAVAGCSILVTGAAGSIGFELCNQLAKFKPRRLVALDQAESEIFRLESVLRSNHPSLDLAPEIADIRDPRRIDEVIDHHAVNSIFHAAAYKHVPLMEYQIYEAVRNNILGTWNLVQAAGHANVSNFLLISSDKAVNPSSIMGVTKRVAELIVSAKRPAVRPERKTKFVCVRFGNVLVSNGSVVPIFQKQIAAGGPVTVTHPDVRRYFMTVQEAVALVLEASAMASGSEIYVLDMGKSVRIVDLARKMITLAGFVPGEDIEIRIVGLRPGEKIFEELSFAGENILPTTHERIRIFQGQQLTLQELAPWIAELQHHLWRHDPEALIAHMMRLVPEYRAGTQSATCTVRAEAGSGRSSVPAPAGLTEALRAAG